MQTTRTRQRFDGKLHALHRGEHEFATAAGTEEELLSEAPTYHFGAEHVRPFYHWNSGCHLRNGKCVSYLLRPQGSNQNLLQ